MKKIISFLIIICCAINLYSQSIERYTISSLGGSYFDGSSFEMDFTMGEMATTTLSNANNTLTQGFQQPFTNTFVVISEDSDEPSLVSVFPNPAIDQLTIQIEGNEAKEYSLTVYNMLGQVALCATANSDLNGYTQIQLDISSLSTGNYYLRIFNDDRLVSIAKIIKLNQ